MLWDFPGRRNGFNFQFCHAINHGFDERKGGRTFEADGKAGGVKSILCEQGVGSG